jgi:hypothetical protein
MTIKAVISQEKRTRDIFKIDKKNECKCWKEFYKYVKTHKGSREDSAMIRIVMGSSLPIPLKGLTLKFLLFFGVQLWTQYLANTLCTWTLRHQ